MSSKTKKSKEVVENILASMKKTCTTEKILKEFQQPKDKIDNKLCMAILRSLVKNNPKAKKPFEEIINNFDKHEPYECLEKFLVGFYKENSSPESQGLSNLGPSNQASAINNSKLSEPSPELRQSNISKQNKSSVVLSSTKEGKPDIPSPGFSSTKINDELVAAPVLNVTDIKNRVVKAAIDGVSKWAQNSVVDPPQSSSSMFHDANVKKNLWFIEDADLVMQNCKTSSVLATPLADQERILLKEILYCLIGVPGTHIKPETIYQSGNPLPTMVFNISTDVNVSLKDMASGILPLANYYSQVQRFILIVTSSPNSGQTLQSLTATLRSLTFDYFHTLVKLEDDITKMNLNRLHHCLRPSMKAMELLAEVVNEIAGSEVVGAKVLTMLSEKVSLLTGDSIGQQLLVDLVEAAAVPYFETLERWILKGKF